MSSLLTDRTYLLTQQYRNASNLNARAQLHARFSTNPYGWLHWLFDQLDLPPGCQVLEVGCGPGGLWLENRSRPPAGWKIVLSDLSAGMVHQARMNLRHSRHPFEFAVLDAQAIPFPGKWFDAVIANLMLYHVPNRVQALSEIWRVLKPGGRLVASTVGEAHLRELKALVSRFGPDLASESSAANPFTLENGGAQLSPWFSGVTIRRYEDALEVTEAAPLVEYVLSESTRMTGDQRLQFAEHVEQEMAAQGGAIHITKDSGIFEAVRR